MELGPQPGAGPERTGNQEEGVERQEALRDLLPRIYVASLSDYNAGILHGEWIDAAQEPEELHEAAAAMLARSPSDPRAEEFAVHDYDNFGHYQVGEYDSLEWISTVARGIGEHGLAFAAWAEQCDHDDEQLAKFDEAYLGEYGSPTDYAEQLLDDLGVDATSFGPDWLSPYIHLDVEAFSRDLVLGGDINLVEHPGGVWVFEGRA